MWQYSFSILLRRQFLVWRKLYGFAHWTSTSFTTWGFPSWQHSSSRLPSSASWAPSAWSRKVLKVSWCWRVSGCQEKAFDGIGFLMAFAFFPQFFLQKVCLYYLNDPENAQVSFRKSILSSSAIKNPLIYLNYAIFCLECLKDPSECSQYLNNFYNLCDTMRVPSEASWNIDRGRALNIHRILYSQYIQIAELVLAKLPSTMQLPETRTAIEEVKETKITTTDAIDNGGDDEIELEAAEGDLVWTNWAKGKQSFQRTAFIEVPRFSFHRKAIKKSFQVERKNYKPLALRRSSDASEKSYSWLTPSWLNVKSRLSEKWRINFWTVWKRL